MREPTNQIEAALSAAVALTLEGMAFEVVELADDDRSGCSDGNEAWVALEIMKPYAGQVVVEMPWDYAEIIARALYGELDGAVPRDVIWDALAELSNTLAGRFMLELLGPSSDYTLGFPIAGHGVCPVTEDGSALLSFTGSDYTFRVAVTGQDFKCFSNIADKILAPSLKVY
jgi:CheY-specific phosphatase CheX